MLSSKYFAVAVLLAIWTQVEGGAFCDQGKTEKDEVNTILSALNDHRSKVVRGEQQNGPNGTNKLPPGKNMNQLDWSCDLKNVAAKELNSQCPSDVSTLTSSDRSQIFRHDYIGDDYPQLSISEILISYLGAIDDEGLISSGEDVKLSNLSSNSLRQYANLINPETTEIGCTTTTCTEDSPKYTVYCLTNRRSLEVGDTIYEKGNGGCDSCPSGTVCNSTTGMCVSVSSTTTSTTTTTTTKAPTTTSALKAILPDEKEGVNTVCPLNDGMIDELRMHFTDMHNYRRSELAFGKIQKNNGNYLPTAGNMYKLEYNCELEAGAIERAKQCPRLKSSQSSRPGIGENFRRFPITGDLPTYRDAIKEAITQWWKVVRHCSGIGLAAIFREKHVGTAIVSFTQMAWATTRYLGCSIAKCGSDYVAVCRYQPRGNIVEENVYKPGTTCTLCTSCDTDTGLCL